MVWAASDFRNKGIHGFEGRKVVGGRYFTKIRFGIQKFGKLVLRHLKLKQVFFKMVLKRCLHVY